MTLPCLLMSGLGNAHHPSLVSPHRSGKTLAVSLVSVGYLPYPACVRAVCLPKGATLLCFILGISLFQNSTFQRPLRCGLAQILWGRVSLHCGQCWLVVPRSSGSMFVVNCNTHQPELWGFVTLSQLLCSCTIRWSPHCPLPLGRS